VRVTLVDRHNHHIFQPLLTPWRRPACRGDIAARIRWVLRHHDNACCWPTRGIDLAARRVDLDHGDSLSCDYLILAAGRRLLLWSRRLGAARPSLKTLDDALR
jgi:NADH dehydrogenase